MTVRERVENFFLSNPNSPWPPIVGLTSVFGTASLLGAGAGVGIGHFVQNENGRALVVDAITGAATADVATFVGVILGGIIAFNKDPRR